jgi:hypothetical protein
MHGVIGRVSPDYLRDPLIKTHGEPAGAGGHVCIGEGIEESRIRLRKRILQPVQQAAFPSLEPRPRVMPDELTDSIREIPLLQEPATVERMHPDPDEPGRIPDVVEPSGSNKVRGFIRLEDCGDLFRFPRDPLRMGEAIGQAGEKLAGEVLSGCGRLGHRSSR